MAKREPTESDLGFNPYIFDEDTYRKLNYTHYSPANVDHRKRLQKWKEREQNRRKLAEKLGVEYFPNLTPVSQILRQSK